MKRILFVVQLPPPIHGVSIMNENLVRNRYIKENYETQFINISMARTIEDVGGFTFAKIFRSVEVSLKLLKLLREFKPDLVYFTIAPSGIAFYRDALFIFLIKTFRSNLAIHLHGVGIERNSRRNILFRWLCKKIFRDANVIHLSHRLASDTAAFKKKKSFIVNNGIPLSFSFAEKNNDTGCTQILFLSNFLRSKGVLDLIDAIEIVSKSNQKFQLSLVGKSFDLTIREINEYISKKQLSHLVSVSGPKYNGEKDAEFKKANIFVLPTYYPNEAFPLVLLEAMQAGLPVLATDVGGIPDIIEDGRTGFIVQKRDLKRLSEKISFLIQHPEIRTKMGEEGRKVFVQKFTLSIFEKSMVSAFDEILKD